MKETFDEILFFIEAKKRESLRKSLINAFFTEQNSKMFENAIPTMFFKNFIQYTLHIRRSLKSVRGSPSGIQLDIVAKRGCYWFGQLSNKMFREKISQFQGSFLNFPENSNANCFRRW